MHGMHDPRGATGAVPREVDRRPDSACAVMETERNMQGCADGGHVGQFAGFTHAKSQKEHER